MVMESISRDVKEGIGPDGIDVRLYNYNGHDLPSVTTILKSRDEDTSNLDDWKEKYNGKGDIPYWRHLFWYSRHRGTLGHFMCLSQLDPSLGWSGDEAQSVYELKYQTEEDVEFADEDENTEATPEDVLYSVQKYHGVVESWGDFYDAHGRDNDEEYYREKLVEHKDRDVEHLTQVFNYIVDALDVEDIISVEQYLFETEYGYAGQVDLAWYDHQTDEVVVSDLKTSSGCYAKHKLQGAAYGKAIELEDSIEYDTVDRLEVWRIHPDSGQWAVHSHDDERSPLHTDDYWRKDFDTLWNEFRELAENFEYDEYTD